MHILGLILSRRLIVDSFRPLPSHNFIHKNLAGDIGLYKVQLNAERDEKEDRTTTPWRYNGAFCYTTIFKLDMQKTINYQT